MTVLEGLLDAIVEEPLAEDRWSVVADWLEENDDPRRAELLRLHRRMLATCCNPDVHPRRRDWQARIVELLVQGVRPCVPQRPVMLGEKTEMMFHFVPPGSFLMGCPENEAGRSEGEQLHQVTFTAGFWMADCPITQAQWQAVMGSNPSRFKAKNRPVERVSWHDCHEFCNRPDKASGHTFRLPTEAEWEYACRAGTTTPFHFGDTISTDQANYNGAHIYGSGQPGVYRNKTTFVRSFPPNAWGLFDMHGNVWEWCADRVVRPGYPDADLRVLRGGCWRCYPVACRSAYRRHQSTPDSRDGLGGFRVCLTAPLC